MPLVKKSSTSGVAKKKAGRPRKAGAVKKSGTVRKAGAVKKTVRRVKRTVGGAASRPKKVKRATRPKATGVVKRKTVRKVKRTTGGATKKVKKVVSREKLVAQAKALGITLSKDGKAKTREALRRAINYRTASPASRLA
jgi:hypothetical protein